MGLTTALIAGSIGGAVIAGRSAERAADTQADAAEDAQRRADETQRYMFDRNIELTEPWREIGEQGLNALRFETLGGDRPDGYAGFQESPGYKFALDEGMNALGRSQAARGRSLGGPAMKEAMRFGTGLASQEYGNFLGRVSDLAGVGRSAVSDQVNIGTGYANNVSQNALRTGDIVGQARASGYEGQNAAIQGGLNNVFSTLGMAQSGMLGPNPGFGITPNPAGLSGYGY